MKKQTNKTKWSLLTYSQESLPNFLSNEVWQKHNENRLKWGLCPWRQEDVTTAFDTGQEESGIISIT